MLRKTRTQPTKAGVKKQTIKDLTVAEKATEVKGGRKKISETCSL